MQLRTKALLGIALLFPLVYFASKAFGRRVHENDQALSSMAGNYGLQAMTSQAVIFHVTAPDDKVASNLSKKLIEKKLAACVQKIPGIESTYSWEGKVETAKEYLLLIKTKKALTDKVIELVSAEHPYDVPEILSTPVEGGLPSYLKWLDESTS